MQILEIIVLELSDNLAKLIDDSVKLHDNCGKL